MFCVGIFRGGVRVWFTCLILCAGCLSSSNSASSVGVVAFSLNFLLYDLSSTNSPLIHSNATLFTFSTVLSSFGSWARVGATGCRRIGFGAFASCSLGLGGLGGGRTLLGSNLRRHFLLAELSLRMSCMNSLNSDIFVGGILFASTWLSVLMQLSKQWRQMFQRGHILQSPFQWILSWTLMLAKSFAHVSPCSSLNSGQGEVLFTLLLILFSPGPPPFLPPGFLALPGDGSFLGSSLPFGGAKDDGSFSSKVPKWTCSIRPQKLRIVSSTLFLWVAVMQSSNHSWKQVSTAYMNLQQNFWSDRSGALNANLHLST
jgi:hypothetical protein